jgi:hypothetical protein
MQADTGDESEHAATRQGRPHARSISFPPPRPTSQCRRAASAGKVAGNLGRVEQIEPPQGVEGTASLAGALAASEALPWDGRTQDA